MGDPVADDTIFRIYSMTKPVTGVALLSLYEQGHFQLERPDPPVPARAAPTSRCASATTRTASAAWSIPARPVSVRDVLMHTSGFGYEALLGGRRAPLGAPAPGPEAGAGGDPAVSGFLRPSTFSLAALIGRLAERPLHFHPGTRWLYSVSTDVCAAWSRCISGRPFDEYLHADHLRARWAWTTPASPCPTTRSTASPPSTGATGGKELVLADDPLRATTAPRRSCCRAAAGLVSTTADYLRFCQMLLNGGELDGVRILGRKTVELMAQNHLPGGVALADVARGYGEVGFNGMGFGLTVAVSQGPVATGVVGSAGSYSWGGAASTAFWIDPIEDLVAIFMVQFLPSGTFDFRNQLQTLVYAALTD